MFEYIVHATHDPDGLKAVNGRDHMAFFRHRKTALDRAEALAVQYPDAYISVQVEYREV